MATPRVGPVQRAGKNVTCSHCGGKDMRTGLATIYRGRGFWTQFYTRSTVYECVGCGHLEFFT